MINLAQQMIETDILGKMAQEIARHSAS